LVGQLEQELVHFHLIVLSFKAPPTILLLNLI